MSGVSPGFCLIGLDFGTDSARGVLVDAATCEQLAHHVHPYRQGVMTTALPSGTALPPGYALQDAADYVEAAADILGTIGAGRVVVGIGLDFTASSPLPARADGTPLSALHPADPHAYVKLWKHAAAQPYAERIGARGGAFLDNFGGRVSGEWLLAKAAQLEAEAPALWNEAERFIEAGDWLVWQLTGREVRSLDFAAYKAQFTPASGYPEDVVPGLGSRLAAPHPVGTRAGTLTPAWRERTGIRGDPAVAVAVIDSHVVLPAVGATAPGTLVGALGTSAAYLLLDDRPRPLPAGIEGVAEGAVLPDLWCYEAGQAGFGDTLAWFVRTFPRADEVGANFRAYNEAAAAVEPRRGGLVALDWWSGNRVPHADSGLTGLVAGLTLSTTAIDIYRALLDALCFGARSVADHLAAGSAPIDRVLMTSGLALNNPLLIRIMADVLGRPVEVPALANPTAVGAAIHGAVAAGLVADFADGARRFGAKTVSTVHPDPTRVDVYAGLYGRYRDLAGNAALRNSLRA